ncbi:hypothetical protein EYD25_22425 [Klebsiella pneumoniae]|uniref:hypothetical protein n=1 Tax=Klebsiella pneumoniae TaxID=573 RepID=UPI00102E227D|nr:hypothetical protein [Klebsiella pneumoniae]TAI00364.1 hypothetical protein EYD25_22425 [Klebsiella pneumoniae]HBR1781005.1 hypothetical protein [Klebsiella quasipneumoniae subsp. quasipneumoniae]
MTIHEKFLEKCRNNKLIVFISIISIAITGLSNFSSSVKNLASFFPCSFINAPLICNTESPAYHINVNSGWIFIGYLDKSGSNYITEPSYTIKKSMYQSKELTPRPGEILRLAKEKKLYIVDFKNQGTTNEFISPIKANIVRSEDLTGDIIPKGAIVEVRDVDIYGHDGNNKAVWARIAQTSQ